jgi:hypothetical protein
MDRGRTTPAATTTVPLFTALSSPAIQSNSVHSDGSEESAAINLHSIPNNAAVE